MLPTGTVHIDTFLSGHLIGKTNANYIADQVLPPVFTNKISGKVAKMGEDHYRINFSQRAPGTPGNIVNWSVSAVDYKLDEYRLEHPIDDIEKGQVDDPFDLRRDAQLVLWHSLSLKKEVDSASLVMAAGNYGTGHTDTTNRSWNVPATGTPIDDVQRAVGTIVSKGGVSEERIFGACSFAVFSWLRTNNQVKAVFAGMVATGLANAPAVSVSALSKKQVAMVLGLADLYVGTAVQNTAAEGATAVKSYVWGADDFAVFYKSEDTGLMIPNFGYGVYPNIPDLPGAQVVSDVYRREDLTSDVVRSRLLLDSIVADNELGFLFTSVDNA